MDCMRRICALFAVLLTLACGVGGWVAAGPQLTLLVVPDATDIRVARLGWNEWQISYRAAGSPTTWHSDVAHQLEAQHWSSPDRVEYAPFNRIYSRAVSFGFGELWEWAFLTFDPRRPHDVQIKVRRWIAIPW
jgi:hypothetical protein